MGAMFLRFCAQVFSKRVDRATSCTTRSGGAKPLQRDIFLGIGIHGATRPQLLFPVATKPNPPASRHSLDSNWTVLAQISESGPRAPSFTAKKRRVRVCGHKGLGGIQYRERHVTANDFAWFAAVQNIVAFHANFCAVDTYLPCSKTVHMPPLQ